MREMAFDVHRHKAVIFVKAQKKKDKAECESDSENTAQVTLERLSGTEAKQFYEDVISTPKESREGELRTSTRKRRQSKVKKRTQANKILKTDETSPATRVSVSRVFCYAQEGDLERIKDAISNGRCDINATDHFHWTLLMSAAYAGHTHIVEYLLSMGARWRDYVDRSGCNAVDLARRAGHIALACFTETYEDATAVREGTTNDTSQHGTQVATNTGHATTGSRFGRAQHRTPTSSYCDICEQNVTESFTEKHTTSTVHQFSCQHGPPIHSYVIPQSNRGYQMMLRSGWDPERGLGADQEGKKFPVKTILKRNRLGFGQTEEQTSQRKARVTHFAAFDERAVRRRPLRTAPTKRKRDIVMEARKDKEWEVRMRRYMNSDHEYDCHYLSQAHARNS